ncbi:bacterial Ig-like domain-containing protein, partial [Bariatricus massiliensis]
MKKRRHTKGIKRTLCLFLTIMVMTGLINRSFADEMEDIAAVSQEMSQETAITVAEEPVTEEEVVEEQVTEDSSVPEDPVVEESEAEAPSDIEESVSEEVLIAEKPVQEEVPAAEETSEVQDQDLLEDAVSPAGATEAQKVMVHWMENGLNASETMSPIHYAGSKIDVDIYQAASAEGPWTYVQTISPFKNGNQNWLQFFNRDSSLYYKIEPVVPDGYSAVFEIKDYAPGVITEGSNILKPGTPISSFGVEIYMVYGEVVKPESPITGFYVGDLPSKMDYTIGESLDKTGMTCRARRSNNTFVDIDPADCTVEPAVFTEVGKQLVIVSYYDSSSGKTFKDAGFLVTVTAGETPVKTLSSIAITTAPAKITYTEGESFDKTGMVVTATYSDNSTEKLADGAYTFAPNRPLTTADTKIIVTYQGKTAIQNIKVNPQEATLTEIYVKNAPATVNYIEGQKLSLTGMQVYAKYSNKTEKDVTGSCTFLPANGAALKTTDTAISISYKEGAVTKTASQTITVSKKEMTGLVITGTAAKTNYLTGETFDPAGLTFTVQYNDDSTKAVSADACKITPSTLTKETTKVTVTFTEGGKNVSAEYGGITVEDDLYVLDSLEITTPPSKITYIEGQTFDPAGIVVEAVSKNSKGEEKRETVTASCTYVPSLTTPLQTTNSSVQISYSDTSGKDKTTKTVVQYITVVKKTLTEIVLSGKAATTTYMEGESFEPDGITVTAKYNNGSQKVLKPIEYSISPAVLSVGDKKVTFSYEENGVKKTADYTGITVNAVPAVLQSLQITHNPDKVIYTEGENFDPTGLILTAVYDKGGNKVLNPGEYTVTPDRALRTTDTQMTFSYTDGGTAKQVSLKITVEKKPEPVTLTGIQVTTPPTKANYVEGQIFNPAGMVVTATYSDGTMKTVTGYTCTPSAGTALTTADTNVTVAYTEDGNTFTASSPIHVAKKEVIGIHTEGTPKVTYVEGESFQAAGMKVFADYNDGTKAEVSGYVVTPNPLTKETTEVTITYAGFSVKYTGIIVAEAPVVLDHIYIHDEPKTTTYVEGQSFKPEGLVVMAVYSNDQEAEVTGSCSFSPDIAEKLKTTHTKIVVTYKEGDVEKTTEQEIKVNPKVLASIRLEGKAQREYKTGESFNPEGLNVYAVYNDNSEVAAALGACTIEPDPLTAGITQVTITYMGKSAVYRGLTVTDPVVEPTLTGISVTVLPKTSYVEGQTFDPAGIEVTASYSDNTSKKVTDVTYSPDENTPLTTDDTKITVNYTEKDITVETEIPVTVTARVLDKLVITGEAKKDYKEGESFDPTGLTVTAVYDNGDEEVIDLADCTIAPDPLTEADTKVTISYTEDGETKSADYEGLTVTKEEAPEEPRILTSIKITGDAKKDYKEGESFDPTGLTVTAVYDNGDEEVIDLADCTIAPDPLTEADTKVTISYTEDGETKSADYEGLTVTKEEAPEEPRILTSIKITGDAKKDYKEGESFDPTGLTVTAVYDNGDEEVIDLADCTIAPDPLTEADTKVTISYTEDGETKSADYEGLTVTKEEAPEEPRILTSIKVTGDAKKDYKEGESFDPTGLTVTAVYDNGDEEVIDLADCTIAPDPLTEADTKVTISYTEDGETKSADYEGLTVTKEEAPEEPRILTSIKVTGDAKKDYKEGESFDPTGLTVT